MVARVRYLLVSEDGQAMVEYGVIGAALIVGLAMAIKLVQVAMSRSLANHQRAMGNAP
jgi:Flp pilus assembly pilin Flp